MALAKVSECSCLSGMSCLFHTTSRAPLSRACLNSMSESLLVPLYCQWICHGLQVGRANSSMSVFSAGTLSVLCVRTCVCMFACVNIQACVGRCVCACAKRMCSCVPMCVCSCVHLQEYACVCTRAPRACPCTPVHVCLPRSVGTCDMEGRGPASMSESEAGAGPDA